MARKVLAGLLACALLQAPAATADLSYGAHLLEEGATRIESIPVRLFAVRITDRQPLMVAARSDDFAPLIYLVSPDKRVWSEDQASGGRASISVEDAAPGDWYVAVRSVIPRAGGAFDLAVTGEPAPVGPALSPDAEVAVAALRLWSGIDDPSGRDAYAAVARGIQPPGADAPPTDAAAVPPPAEAPAEPAPEPLRPLLPWPPPEPSARMLLPARLLAEPATLGQVDDRLRDALGGAGYDDLGYFAIPDGYAAVTRLERIDEGGQPVADADRWEMELPTVRSFDLLDYLRALLTAQTGHFRVIAFVVTSAPFTAPAADVDAAAARRWAQSGHNALTAEVRSQPFTAAYTVTALVYEFSKVRGERNVHFDLPGDLTATTHLQAAGILAALQN